MIYISKHEAAALRAAFDWFSAFGSPSPIGFSSLNRPEPGAIHFIDGARAAKRIDVVEDCLLLAPSNSPNSEERNSVSTPNPRLAICDAFRLLDNLRYGETEFSQHKGAHIAKGLEVPESCRIEPGVVIHPDVEISADCTIRSNAVIHPGVKLGPGCVVGNGVALGVSGFGYAFPDDDWPRQIAHLGGVEVGEAVDFGPNSVVCAGTIDPTVVGSGTKIEGNVYLGHNTQIGERAMICANSVIGGSSRIGANTWIYPGAIVKTKISIGQGASVGSGAVVMKPVHDEETVMGDTASEVRDRLRREATISRMVKNRREGTRPMDGS
jgi:UDP-3-O-[3-hydroxymyristoyl] glucosamine N-acyltransferase LpxD